MTRGKTKPSETLPVVHQLLPANDRVGAGTKVDPIRDRVKAYDARLMPVRPTVTAHEPPEDPAELWIVLSDRADARINGGMAPTQSTPTSEQCMGASSAFKVGVTVRKVLRITEGREQTTPDEFGAHVFVDGVEGVRQSKGQRCNRYVAIWDGRWRLLVNGDGALANDRDYVVVWTLALCPCAGILELIPVKRSWIQTDVPDCKHRGMNHGVGSWWRNSSRFKFMNQAVLATTGQ